MESRGYQAQHRAHKTMSPFQMNNNNNNNNNNKNGIKSRLGWTPRSGNGGNNHPNGSTRKFGGRFQSMNQNRGPQPAKSFKKKGPQPFKSANMKNRNFPGERKGVFTQKKKVVLKRYNNNQRRDVWRNNVTGSNVPAPNNQRPVRAQSPANNQVYVVESMYETVPLLVFCRRFTAVVNSGTSMTRIGSEIAARAVANGFEKKERLLVLGQTETRVQMITILLGTRMARLKPVDCLIDPVAHPLSITLG
ncbi:hypothetical protein ACFFRR_001073 [Megaselia abdita]